MIYKDVEVRLHSFVTWAVGGQANGQFHAVLLKLAKDALAIRVKREAG